MITLVIYDIDPIPNKDDPNFGKGIFNIQYPDGGEENIYYTDKTGSYIPRIEKMKSLQGIVNKLEEKGYQINKDNFNDYLRGKVKYLFMQLLQNADNPV